MLHDLSRLKDNTGLEWKRINMRKVEHLPAVELIHDLYNQYDFRLNALRFRNTITTWKDGVVNSYAPVFEWNDIENYLGDKFYRVDKLLLKELTALYESQRNFATDYLKSIDIKRLDTLEPHELRDVLLNIQNFTLGDLYRLNFVQVEHALTSAVKRTLKDLNIDSELLSSLILSDELTEFQKEEVAFAELTATCTEENTDTLLQKHWDRYAHMHCAYGEVPYTLEYYRQKLESYVPNDIDIQEQVRVNATESRKILTEINSEKLSTLIRLMVKGGEFRDINKARLGQTMRYKFAVLDEIVLRTNVPRNDISFYSMSDICTLLTDSIKVAEEVIANRRERGVVLSRTEFIDQTGSVYDIGQSSPIIEFNRSKNVYESNAENLVLEGLGASPGVVEGIARIVLSYEDGKKVSEGDVMVAIGTDFDLMDAIQRSAAVITEEGGFLSHASVVCRELKKPCCIAVENATSVIKDGTRIQINAEKGVIKIINND